MAYNQPVHGGAADAYYQEGQQDIRMQQPYQQQYPPPNEQPQQYSQQPPQYSNGRQEHNDVVGKVGFDQTFKVDKPKYNDIWATILFILTFVGFAGVSGLAIHGYAATKSEQGNGFGGSSSSTTNTVSLNTNTVVLLYVELIGPDGRC